MSIDWKSEVLMLGGGAIVVAAGIGLFPFTELPWGELFTTSLVLGTMGAQRRNASHGEQPVDCDGLPADLVSLLPESRHSELASIAHEYKNIFQVILGHVFLVLDQLDCSDPNRDNLKQMQQSAQRGAKLADRLYHLSHEVVSDKHRTPSRDAGS